MGRILILKEAAYGSREEPPTMTRLMQGNYPEKPEACTICGNSPVVAGAQFRNRLGNINYTHHLCEPCADQYDIMHSADMYKGEPMDIAMRLLKKLPPHWSRDFDTIEELRDPKHGIQSMRAMSLGDAQNVEQIPLRSGNIEFERDITDNKHELSGARSIVPGIDDGNIYDESLVREGGGFVYRPHLNALAPSNQYTDMPMSTRPNVLVASTEIPEFRASKNEGRIQTEGFMPVGMDPDQAYLLSDPTKPFTRENLLQQARIKQAGGIPYHARSDIENHPLDEYYTASQALETLPIQYVENPFTQMGTWGQPRVVSGPRDSDVFFLSEPMEIAMRLLKRQTTLSAFDEQQIQENLKPENSNIFIAAKPGKEETRPGELSQLSDNMLAELAALKEKHGEFGITSATGNAGWELEPSFMLTNVPQSARDEINAIAEKYRQDSIAVSEQNETGVKFVTPQGQVTDEYRNMQMDPNAEYSTDFPTGQRLTFKSEPMEIAMRLLKGVFPLSSPSMVGHTKEYENFFNENILPQAENEEHAKRLKLAFNHMQNFYLPKSFTNNPGSSYKDRFTSEDKERSGRYRNLGRAGFKYWSDANKKGHSLSTGRGEVHPREYLEENDLAEQEEIKELLSNTNNTSYKTRHYAPTYKQGKFLTKPINRHIENEKPLTDTMQNNLIDASVRGQLSSENPLSDLEYERQFMDLPLIQSITPKSPLQSELVYGELNDNSLFNYSEPMEIAMQLLKERVSPEAKRHKLEYDKKYESSPERVKYREELNRERRRRHIMGQGGPDMSHTSQHTIVPEDPHTNRARHFKDKGTLL